MVHLCFISYSNHQSLCERQVNCVRAWPSRAGLSVGTSPNISARQGHAGTAAGVLPLWARASLTEGQPWALLHGRATGLSPSHKLVYPSENGLLIPSNKCHTEQFCIWPKQAAPKRCIQSCLLHQYSNTWSVLPNRA